MGWGVGGSGRLVKKGVRMQASKPTTANDNKKLGALRENPKKQNPLRLQDTRRKSWPLEGL